MKNCGLDKVQAEVSTCLQTISVVSVEKRKRRGLKVLFPEKQRRERWKVTTATADRLIQAATQWASSIS